ncbi:MAG: hypothetical protein HWQ23_05330 [Nostoc sp. JL33]|uniref:hypothetical protein n=1 Tax=unclassified Nostoc TaxID=2593658 RepID=UPI0025D45C3A|nr:hypothetical protein [Nostoc sp. JL33]MBN3869735.1 hypothetical protein [Nostoc sp. JL33]
MSLAKQSILKHRTKKSRLIAVQFIFGCFGSTWMFPLYHVANIDDNTLAIARALLL